MKCFTTIDGGVNSNKQEYLLLCASSGPRTIQIAKRFKNLRPTQNDMGFPILWWLKHFGISALGIIISDVMSLENCGSLLLKPSHSLFVKFPKFHNHHSQFQFQSPHHQIEELDVIIWLRTVDPFIGRFLQLHILYLVISP